MGLFWVSDVLLGGDARVVDLALSLFVIPIAIGIDHLGRSGCSSWRPVSSPKSST